MTYHVQIATPTAVTLFFDHRVGQHQLVVDLLSFGLRPLVSCQADNLGGWFVTCERLHQTSHYRLPVFVEGQELTP